jgi:gas vesicle protein GvpN
MTSTPAPRSPWAGLSRKDSFFEDDAIRALLQRAETYVAAGTCLHLSGPAGLGKTTLAMLVAERIGRPVSFMTGNQWLEASDMIGREVGESTRTVVDKYIQSVRRTDTEVRADWRASILALSMQNGYTLVYDEFTRASPEANSVLLSVMEEGVLVTTDRASKRSYIEAHPDFRIILTSNPHDYIGVNGAPDALLDRMVTLSVPRPSARTMAGIIALRSGLDPVTSKRIVALVQSVQKKDQTVHGSQLRAALSIARIATHMKHAGPLGDDALAMVATDVLAGRGWDVTVAQLVGILAPATQKAAS